MVKNKYDILPIYTDDGLIVIGHKVCFDAQTLYATLITKEISYDDSYNECKEYINNLKEE